VIFGLLIAFFSEVPDALLYGTTAMVYGVLVMTDGILTIIGAPKGAGRRPLLRLESRISLLAGAVTFSLGLVASWLVDIGISPGNIVFLIVGLWAICIGVVRLVRAIWLKFKFKIVRLMVMSDTLLLLFGMFLLFHLWDPRLLLGVWPLTSGISLLVFAFQARDLERRGVAG
jgi:hypothetical protein